MEGEIPLAGFSSRLKKRGHRVLKASGLRQNMAYRKLRLLKGVHSFAARDVLEDNHRADQPVLFADGAGDVFGGKGRAVFSREGLILDPVRAAVSHGRVDGTCFFRRHRFFGGGAIEDRMHDLPD